MDTPSTKTQRLTAARHAIRRSGKPITEGEKKRLAAAAQRRLVRGRQAD